MGVSNDPYKDVADKDVAETQPWWWRADCAKPENSWIFVQTEILGNGHRYHVMAKAVCHECPVLAQCRKDVLMEEAGTIRGELVGVRAEMSSPARAKITSQICRECKVAKKLPHIALCGSCREARRLRRYREPLRVA